VSVPSLNWLPRVQMRRGIPKSWHICLPFGFLWWLGIWKPASVCLSGLRALSHEPIDLGLFRPINWIKYYRHMMGVLSFFVCVETSLVLPYMQMSLVKSPAYGGRPPRVICSRSIMRSVDGYNLSTVTALAIGGLC